MSYSTRLLDLVTIIYDEAGSQYDTTQCVVALCCIAFVMTLVGMQHNARIDSDPILAYLCVAFLRQIVKLLNINFYILQISATQGLASLCEPAFIHIHLHTHTRIHTQLRSRPLCDSNKTVTCKVKFSGSNVLEGIKESVAYGCVALPVPTVLKSLPQCSTNRVTVEIENQPPLLGNHNGNSGVDHSEITT